MLNKIILYFQGEAIIMNATDFVQNMDHFEALKKRN